MKPWQIVALVLGVWNILGMTVALFNTANERSGCAWCKPVIEPKSGCVYKSYASFTNPGYVFACEMFRKRFELEGIHSEVKQSSSWKESPLPAINVGCIDLKSKEVVDCE